MIQRMIGVFQKLNHPQWVWSSLIGAEHVDRTKPIPLAQVYVCGASTVVAYSREGLWEVRVSEHWCKAGCCWGKTVSQRNRWQHGGGVWGRRGLMFLLFPVCVYPWGVSKGYGCHIVPDISCVMAQRGSSVVLSVKPNTWCVIQERIMQTTKLSSPGFVAPIGVLVKICIQVWEAAWGI